jgi:hypothetical protein
MLYGSIGYAAYMLYGYIGYTACMLYGYTGYYSLYVIRLYRLL